MNRPQGPGQPLRNVSNPGSQTSQSRNPPTSRLMASKSGAWGTATSPAGGLNALQPAEPSGSWAQAMNSRSSAQLDLSSSSFPSLAGGSSHNQNSGATSSQWQAGPPQREQGQMSNPRVIQQRQQPLSTGRDGLFSDFTSSDRTTRRGSTAPDSRFPSSNPLTRGAPPGLVPTEGLSGDPSRVTSPLGGMSGMNSVKSPESQGLNGAVGQDKQRENAMIQRTSRGGPIMQNAVKDLAGERESVSPNGEQQDQNFETTFRGMSEREKWGMVGWQALHGGPNAELRALARSQDLGTLSQDTQPGTSLLRSYAGPFAPANAFPPRPLDSDYTIPDCYIVQTVAPVQQRISGFTEDTLFYVFYTSPKDIIQEEVATELMSRKWRFHIKEKMWLTRDDTVANPAILEKDVCEQGYYIWWDYRNWKRIRRAYLLRYEDLDDHLSGGRSLPMPGLFQGGIGLVGGGMNGTGGLAGTGLTIGVGGGANGNGGGGGGHGSFNAVPGLERMVARGF